MRPPPSVTTASPTARVSIAEHATRALGCHRHLDVGPFEIPIGVFDEVGRPAKGGDHLGELLHGRPVEGGFDLRPPVGGVGRQRRQHQHLGTERHDDVVHARFAPGAREVVDGVHDLDGVAGRRRQGLIHVRQHRARRESGTDGHLDDRIGELLGLVATSP